MNDKVFVDTNVLVYLFSETDLDKRNKAYRAVEEGISLMGLNNLNELANVLTKKYRRSYSEIEKVIFTLSVRFKIVDFDSRTILSAVRVMERYRFYISTVWLSRRHWRTGARNRTSKTCNTANESTTR